jgi:predicted RNase H-like HicB family nuclease
MAQVFQVVLEFDSAEHAWVTYVPALDHLSTFGATREEALEHTREAITGYLEAAEHDGITLAATRPAELVELAI